MRNKKQGSVKLDKSEVRRMVQSNIPMSTALGVVRKFPGEDSHFDIDIDENGNKQVFVDVELIPDGEKILCQLGFGGDGIYRIPRVNQEVAVLIPGLKNSLVNDELENNPIIVAILDQQIPDDLDGDDIIIVSAPRVHILSAEIKLGENAEEIAKLSDVQTMRNELHNHSHMYIPYPGGSAGTPVATTGNPSLSQPEGTSVVTAE